MVLRGNEDAGLQQKRFLLRVVLIIAQAGKIAFYSLEKK